MNPGVAGILARLEGHADEIADEITTRILVEVDGLRGIDDTMLYGQIRSLARQHLDDFLTTAGSGSAPSPVKLAVTRQRTAAQAKAMWPLAALVHSYLIGQRVISAAIARAAADEPGSREAALTLTSITFDYNIAVTAAMIDAYAEVVQGDLAELGGARRGLIEVLLSSENGVSQALRHRAISLGFDPDRRYVAVLAVIDLPDDEPGTDSPHWAVSAIMRACGVPERSAFVVSRERDFVALLDATGSQRPRLVLQNAAAVIAQTHRARLRAGLSTEFVGLDGFRPSYQQARRALKHTSQRRPLVAYPDDVLLFDELTVSPAANAAELIPETTRRLFSDRAQRETLDAFVAADLNIVTAAQTLSLHPNSLRYRLKRIAEVTGRNPRKVSDLLELVAAVRLLTVDTTPTNPATQPNNSTTPSTETRYQPAAKPSRPPRPPSHNDSTT